MDETKFKEKIQNVLNEKNCFNVKFFANAYTKKGIPDILASINGYFVGIELKVENNTPSPIQLYQINEINRSGGFALIIYPSLQERLEKLIELLNCHQEFLAQMLVFEVNEKWYNNTNINRLGVKQYHV